MDDQNKNLILATALSFIVILVWFVLFPPPEPALAPPTPAVVAATAGIDAPSATGATPAAEAVAEAARLSIDTPRLSGSISLTGGRIDELKLKDYRVTLDPGADVVQLLRPVGLPSAYYALYGWGTAANLDPASVPGPNTEWTQVGGGSLTPQTPITLQWNNGAGLLFTRDVSIDTDFLFTVTQSVQNNSAVAVSLYPYGIIERQGTPADLLNFFILHEGMVRMVDGELQETKYSNISELPLIAEEGGPTEVVEGLQNGWIGFTDHFWQTILVPATGTPFTTIVKYLPQTDVFRTTVREPVVTVEPGASATSTTRLFAGAKEWETIRAYQNEGGIERFIDSIDWGWFFFLTKPIFAVLHWLNALIGNMGLAIIALTFVLKLIVLPLAYKSYVSMARMKELQPEMEALKERCGDDKQKMQKEMMQLYKDRKVNPAAGCLPILIQIPIFFSLYKVIFVTIELRHAPFFGWLNDLSAPDTSSLFNLFGLLPWAAPLPGSILALIFIGVLPILLGITMWVQQKLNPAPTDPAQAMIFAWMPWMFMFMLGSFASGLVLYWITNNTITFSQQYIIMRSHGHKPDIFGNIRAGLKKKPPVPAKVPEKKAPGRK